MILELLAYAFAVAVLVVFSVAFLCLGGFWSVVLFGAFVCLVFVAGTVLP